MEDLQYENTREAITLSPEAIQQAKALQASNPDWQGLPLRVYLEGKGCDGFYYGVSFDAVRESDLIFQQGESDISLITDSDSYQFIKGSQVIWVDDERGQGFLVENPKHKEFRGKFYKRKAWKEKLIAEKNQN